MANTQRTDAQLLSLFADNNIGGITAQDLRDLVVSKVNTENQIGQLTFAGSWDASTNTPTLSSSSGATGHYYLVSTAGTTTLDGTSDWEVGNWLVFDGSIWVKIEAYDYQTPAAASATEAENWANYPEDQLVPEGDGVDDYSSLHFANKSATSAAASSTYADNAAASASAASASASNAASYEADALGYSQNAASSASSASTSADEAASSATSASQSEQAAASSANYAGIWSNLTGSLSIPASVYHNGIMWTLLNNLTDVTTSEPTTSSSDWLAMYGMLEYPSIRPSLLLDFYSKEIDPRITFSRASNKSYYDHKCRLCYADVDEPTIDHDPVTGECKGLSIWESRTNLLTYSEDFGNGVWGRTNSTIEPNTAVAPDGTLTADKLVDNTDNAEHYMEQILTQTEGTFTKSLYVKKGNSGDYVVIRPVHIGEISSTSIIKFDLNVGPLATTNVLITNAGMDILLDGWRRCWVTYTTTAACTDHRARVQLINSASDNLTYTGDGTSGIYIWGAQLEEGSSPSPYIPSDISFTSRASTALYYDSNGYIQIAGIDEPRYNYNSADLTAPPKLLLEDSSTNLLTYSEDFDNAAWTKHNSSIFANAITAPDGNVTADKVVEDTTAAAIHRVSQPISITSGLTYTVSLYAKAAERSALRVEFDYGTKNAVVLFDLSTGSVTYNEGDKASDTSIKSVGNGWWHVQVTVTADGTSGCLYLYGVPDSLLFGGVAWDGDGTSGIYIWGAQLEEGTYPTSYIPTTSAPVTRAADISTSTATTRAADVAYIDGTDFSDFYNQNEGSVVVEFDTNNSSGHNRILAFSDSILTNNSLFITTSSAHDFLGMQQFSEGSFITEKDVYTDVVGKLLVGAMYQEDLMQGAVDGGVAGNPVSGVKVPTNVDRLTIGYTVTSNIPLNGHIRHLAYYPKALTDNNLIALTTEE